MLRELFVLLVFVVYLNHQCLSYHVVPLADFTAQIENHAVYSTWGKYTYDGAQATMDVYNHPNLKKGEVVAAIVWLSDHRNNDDLSRRNYIQAGWMVSPTVFGDSKTRFFVYWTVAHDTSGCYNLDCDGFVPVNFAPITPGDILNPDNGQNKISFKIFKKKDDGDWWLYFGYDINDLKPVGFWPKNIFTGMVDNAAYISWGGYIGANHGMPSPPMGNGHWAGKNSAFFEDVMFVDTSGQPYTPDIFPRPRSLKYGEDNPKCYQVTSYLNKRFNYGGPGGCTK